MYCVITYLSVKAFPLQFPVIQAGVIFFSFSVPIIRTGMSKPVPEKRCIKMIYKSTSFRNPSTKKNPEESAYKVYFKSFMKQLLVLCAILLLFPWSMSAESWDLGLGVPYMQGRMKQYMPLFLELGVTSVKGYGFSWNYLPSSAGLGESEFKEYEKTNTETYSSNSSQEKYWENTYKTRLSMSSNAFHFYYRIEQYVHRWDLGMIYNTNTYSVRHKKEVRDCTRYISWGSTICSSSTTGALEEKSSDYEVNYLGPFAQYSNTLAGYDRQDIYYGIRLYSMSRSTINSRGLELISSSDSILQELDTQYKQFILDNNPVSTFGINLSLGMRL